MDEPTLFAVKSELDPFDLYGHNSSSSHHPDDKCELKSARYRLAVLRAKDKMSGGGDIFDQADHDLEQIMQLETLNEQERPIMTVFVTPKIREEKHVKLFHAIRSTFSEIFQALIVMLESTSLFALNAPNEVDKLSKRSREFATRLNRSVFETKQQFLAFQGAIVKFHSKRHGSENLKMEVGQRLHSVLRNIHLVLLAYQKHLPLSGGHVYPKSLFKALEIMRHFSKSAKCLGYEAECTALVEDSGRLSNAAAAFERKFHELATNLKPTAPPKKGTAKKLDARLVKHLAKKRFGFPQKHVAKVTNYDASSMKNSERLTSAKEKTAEDTVVEKSEPRDVVHDHVNSTMMDGISLGIDRLTDNELEHANASFASSIKPLRKPTYSSYKVDSHSSGRNLMQKEALLSHVNNLTFLDIDAAELDEIDTLAHIKKNQTLKLPLFSYHYNPIELVARIADKVAMNVIKKVCHEAVEEELVQNLIQNELKLSI